MVMKVLMQIELHLYIKSLNMMYDYEQHLSMRITLSLLMGIVSLSDKND